MNKAFLSTLFSATPKVHYNESKVAFLHSQKEIHSGIRLWDVFEDFKQSSFGHYISP
jgi:hypothetical protein